MLIAALVFAGVLGIILGAYFFGVVRDEKRVLDRLQPRREQREAFRGVLKPEERMSSVGPIQALLVRVAPLSVPLKLLIDQAGLRWNLSSMLLLSLCLGLAAYLLIASAAGLVILGVAAGLLAALAPMAWVRRVRDQRVRKFEEQFPEAVDLVARALRAGHSLPTGLGMVADELPAPVGTEFRIMFDEQNFGLTLGDAMRNFARRVPVLDAKFFVTAVLTQRESGGNLAEVLDNLASVIRARFHVKRQTRVISAHGRLTGFVLAVLPPAIAVATLSLNPGYFSPMLGDPLGQQMIVGAIVLQVIGTLVIRRVVNIEY